MSEIRLHNLGKRTIVGKGYAFAANKIQGFSKAEAEKLLSLYPNEVQDVNAATEKFKDPDAADLPEGWEAKTVPEIKAHLDEKNIAYGKLKKAELVILAEALDGKEVDLTELNIEHLHEILLENEIDFETDANENALIESLIVLIDAKK